MRLNQDQLRFLAAVEPTAKSPILEKLSHIEKLLADQPYPDSYDDADVLMCLERIEKMVSEKKPVSYSFDITRNANGTLARIVATPIRT